MKPYLLLPVRGKYSISEGWIYSKEEQSIHGHEIHYGIDFAQPRGSTVYAAADGWAMGSYQFGYAGHAAGKIKTYNGKKVGYSFGYFVQMYHPSKRRYTQYGHLDSISTTIPFSKPRKTKDGRLAPIGIKVAPSKMKQSRCYTWITAGTKIGTIGDSGLTWGYTDYPNRPDPKKHPSWDETHLHFEEFTRDTSGRKRDNRDPYDTYKDYTEYTPSKRRRKKPNQLWV